MESRLRLYCAVPILLNVGESLTVDSVNEVPAVIGNARGSDFIACTRTFYGRMPHPSACVVTVAS